MAGFVERRTYWQTGLDTVIMGQRFSRTGSD